MRLLLRPVPGHRHRSWVLFKAKIVGVTRSAQALQRHRRLVRTATADRVVFVEVSPLFRTLIAGIAPMMVAFHLPGDLERGVVRIRLDEHLSFSSTMT